MTSVAKDGSVEFWFYRKGASGVRVVGDFAGGGQRDATTARTDAALDMAPRGDGWWRAIATFDSGEYRFRYVADGEWYTDYASNGIEMGEFGVRSVLVVPERAGSAGQTRPAKMVA